MYVAAGFIEDHDHIAVPELGGCCYQLEVGDDVLEIVRALDVAADGDEAEAAYTRNLPNASVRQRPSGRYWT